MNKCCFIIFAHSVYHDIHDLNDIISNINYFHDNCDFIVNHPNIQHPKIRTRFIPGELNKSNFIFGALEEVIHSLSEEDIKSFNHFCLVAANQYFINMIELEKGTNYIQFYNTENWDSIYKGYKTDKTIIGFPLQQNYGRWDVKNLYKNYNIETPMASNWECACLTWESMLNAKKLLSICTTTYPNMDMMSIFPGYMALVSKQNWEFPKHFGTYDPSNPQPKNWLLTTEQIIQKYNDGYFSVKRVGYKKDCPIKSFIKRNFMA
jgi:hypothetical protein